MFSSLYCTPTGISVAEMIIIITIPVTDKHPRHRAFLWGRMDLVGVGKKNGNMIKIHLFTNEILQELIERLYWNSKNAYYTEQKKNKAQVFQEAAEPVTWQSSRHAASVGLQTWHLMGPQTGLHSYALSKAALRRRKCKELVRTSGSQLRNI